MKWPTFAIGDLCLTTGQRDPRRRPEETFVYIDISTIDKDTKHIIAPPVILGADAPSQARKETRAGDVLVSTVRPNLNAVTIVPSAYDGQIASTGFCVLRANLKILDNRYLFYRTCSEEFVSHLTARMRGANYPAVTDEDVRSAPIPLPPLSEQRRIV
jgi:type I restriction enzyme S subunit